MLGLFLGVLAALATIVIFRRFPLSKERQAYGSALIIAALIYVAFAGSGGTRSWLAIEAGGVAAYGALAVLGWWVSPWFLAAGWLLHPVWDVWLHTTDTTPFVPAWYPPACIAYDVVVAGYIAWRIRAWEASSGGN